MFLGINSCFLHLFQLDIQGHFIPILLSQDANVVRFYPPPHKMASNSCNNGHGMCYGNLLPKVKTGKKTKYITSQNCDSLESIRKGREV